MIFFVISGFCIHWSEIHRSKKSWQKFYWKRCFRILPAYWVWLAISVMMVGANLLDILFHAGLIHNLRREYFHSINGPFWSIAVEFQIYLLYPLLLYIKASFDKKVILPVFLLFGLGLGLTGTQAASEFIGSDLISVFGRLPLRLMYAWVLGMYLAEDVKNGLIRADWKKFFIFLICGVVSYAHTHLSLIGVATWSLCAYFFVKSVIAEWSHYQSRARSPIIDIPIRFFCWVGLISYSVYLSHDLLYPVLDSLNFLPDLSPSYYSMMVLTIILLPLMLMIGHASYLVFEKTGISLGRSLQKNKL